jgi:acetylglutamate kinase
MWSKTVPTAAEQRQLIVIKLGGNLLRRPEVSATLATDIKTLTDRGIRLVVVHGAGPQLTEALAAAGIESEFRDGYRYTSDAAMQLMPELLHEQITEPLVRLLQEQGLPATTLDDVPIRAQLKLDAEGKARWGRVGEVQSTESVETVTLHSQLAAGHIPVIASLALDANGDYLNVNADDAAAAISAALGVDSLLLLTDVPGIYSDWPNRDSLISRMSVAEAKALLPKLEAGMVPKLTAALTALDGGVAEVCILDGAAQHSILQGLAADSGVGTRIHP